MKPTNQEVFFTDLEIESLIYDFNLESDFDYLNENWWV
jgi:hypothetical protein